MNTIYLVIGIEIIFLLILILVLYVTKKRVDILLKNIFVNKLQEFDGLLEDRENKVKELSDLIDEKGKEIIDIDLEIQNRINSPNENKIIDLNKTVVLNAIDFEDGNVLAEYKKIKNGFNFNHLKLIKDFIEKVNPSKSLEYITYTKIREYFSYNIIYKLSNYDSNTQKQIIKELLSDKEYKLIENLITKKFNLHSFISMLDSRIDYHDPRVLIYVGNKNENYDNLNEFITTIYDENITEGLKIVHKGRIYDYSI